MTSSVCLSRRTTHIEKEGQWLSIKEQCELLGVPRSSYYYRSQRHPQDSDDMLMQAMDRIYQEEPTYGTRRMVDALHELGYDVGRDLVRSLMRRMGIEPIYPKPRLSKPGQGHKIYPYLLRHLEIDHADQVWCSDITYIPLGHSHVYLTVVLDWYSRYVISWNLSNTLDSSFCVTCLKTAFEREEAPEIFNTDQGSQYTSEAFTEALKGQHVRISMDGRGRALDNRMVERLWRSVKYDDVYLKGYESMCELYQGLSDYFRKYNARKHQGTGRKPEQLYRESKAWRKAS